MPESRDSTQPTGVQAGTTQRALMLESTVLHAAAWDCSDKYVPIRACCQTAYCKSPATDHTRSLEPRTLFHGQKVVYIYCCTTLWCPANFRRLTARHNARSGLNAVRKSLSRRLFFYPEFSFSTKTRPKTMLACGRKK